MNLRDYEGEHIRIVLKGRNTPIFCYGYLFTGADDFDPEDGMSDALIIREEDGSMSGVCPEDIESIEIVRR